MEIEKLIKKYFFMNFKYEEIRNVLLSKHDISISTKTIQRTLRVLGLRRKNFPESEVKEIVAAVVEEIQSCGYNLGYRSLWLKLKKEYKLNVKRDTVYRVLQIADPEGIMNRFGNRLRRRLYVSPGPNFLWHLDGYDKLKPYGFAIHGCIDGFSRMVLWLAVGNSNNDPKITAGYFLDTVQKLNFLPTIIRCDKGTENTLIGSLQICLRGKHLDELSGESSFIQGRSVHNQRIESFWGQMRKHSIDFYINLFKCMSQKNLFDGSLLHLKCLQYCFGPLIMHDLHKTKLLWNEHPIRKQNARNIHGKPYVLFNAPESVNAKNYKKEVDVSVVKELRRKLTTESTLIDPEFHELVSLLIPDVEVASNIEDALNLYKKILDLIEQNK